MTLWVSSNSCSSPCSWPRLHCINQRRQLAFSNRVASSTKRRMVLNDCHDFLAACSKTATSSIIVKAVKILRFFNGLKRLKRLRLDGGQRFFYSIRRVELFRFRRSLSVWVALFLQIGTDHVGRVTCQRLDQPVWRHPVCLFYGRVFLSIWYSPIPSTVIIWFAPLFNNCRRTEWAKLRKTKHRPRRYH